MGNNRIVGRLVWVLGAGLLVLVLLIAAFIVTLPDAEELVPPGANPLVVTVTGPLDGETLPATGFATVTARASGDRPVTSMQLWVDGALLESRTSAVPADGDAGAHWAWTPASPGAHVLVVGATDDSGRQSYSDAVHVLVPDYAGGHASKYQAAGGDTLDAIATKFGIPVDDLAAANPTGTGDEPLTAGETVAIPLPAPPLPAQFPGPEPPPPGPIAPAAGPNNLLVRLSLLTGSDAAPTAPVISAGISGCDVQIFVQDKSETESAFFVYRMEAGSSGFKRIAALGPNNAEATLQFTDTDRFGPASYFVAAFNAAGESASNLASLSVDPARCETSNPPGFELAYLSVTPTQAVDRLYCYLSVSNDTWRRVPGGGRFAYPTDGRFDLTPFLEELPADYGTATFECWGWRGRTLIELGTASGDRPGLDGSFVLASPAFDVDGRFGAIGLLSVGVPVLKAPPPPAPPIMAPFNLRRTADLTTCINGWAEGFGREFLGPLMCSTAIPKGDVILVWDWVPTCIFPPEGSKVKCSDYWTETDGYHVYKTYPGKAPALVATIKDRGQMIFFAPSEAAGLKGPTFTVRAFAGPYESADSNPYTLMDIGSGTESLTLLPLDYSANPLSMHTSATTDADSESSLTSLCTSGTGSELIRHAVDGANVLVGQDYEYFSDDDDCRIWSDNRFYGTVVFNLDPIKGPLSTATLNFTQGEGNASDYLEIISCARSLSTVTSESGGSPTGAEPFRSIPISSGPGTVHSVDVTEAVRDWMLGTANHGFELIPLAEASGGETRSVECWTLFSDFQLDVTYFKK